jgi:hypothetical protein
MMWIRNFSVPDSFPYTIIHGHEPNYLKYINESISSDSKSIDIDNGCCYKDKFFLGNLVCINLKSLELIIEPNRE